MGDAKRILTLEENVVSGGLGSLLCETVAEAGMPAMVKRLGIPDVFHCEIGSREDLRALDGIDLEGVTRAARALMANPL